MESQCDAAGWEILLKILRKAPRKKAKAHRTSLGERQNKTFCLGERQNKTYPCVSKAPQGRVSVQWLSVSLIYPVGGLLKAFFLHTPLFSLFKVRLKATPAVPYMEHDKVKPDPFWLHRVQRCSCPVNGISDEILRNSRFPAGK